MIGQTISHYRILSKLGEGGMGVVYKATDLNLDRSVALKFLPPDLTRDPEAKARFIHEAKAASALDHPNVCTVYEVNETDEGQLFLAMACYEGETLKEKIARGPLKLDEAIVFTRQLAEGLAKAHDKDIVHRDIKPANIFITNDNLVKILDFGLAKLAGQTKITREGTTLGTVAYMSPEQSSGEETDARTDLWSLGAVLYEMVVGRPPFRGDSQAAVIHSLQTDDPEPVTGLRTGAPVELERIINKCLAKATQERYQSAAGFLSDLTPLQKNLERGHSVRTSSGQARNSRGLRWPLAVALIVLGIVVGVIAITTLLRRPDTIPLDESSLAIVDFLDLVDPDDPLTSAEITALLYVGLVESSPIRIVSPDYLHDLRRRAFGSARGPIEEGQVLEVARGCGSTLFLAGRIKRGDYVTWRLVDTGSGKSLAARRVDGGDLAVLADQIIAEVLPVLARESGVDVPDSPPTVNTLTTISSEAHAHYIAGVLARQEARYQDAIRELGYALEQDSTFALALFELSRVRFADGKRGAFVRDPAEKAWALRTQLGIKDRMRLEAWRQQLDRWVTDGLATYREMLARWPDDREVLSDLFGVLYYFWYFEEAVEIAERGLELYPDDLAFLGSYWESLSPSGSPRKAIDTLLGYTSRHPGNEYGWDTLGWRYLEVGLPDSAESAFRKSLEIDPNCYYSQLGIARCAYSKGDVRRSIETFQRILGRNDLSPSRRVSLLTYVRHSGGLSFLYAEAGRFNEALGYFEEVRQYISDIEREARVERERCYLLLRTEKADEVLRSARALAKHTESRYILDVTIQLKAMALAAMDSLEAARSASDELASRENSSGRRAVVEALKINAEIALTDKDPEAALAALREISTPLLVFDMGFLSIEHREALARAHQIAGQLDEATKVHHDLLRVFGGHALSHYELGKLYEEMNRLDEAEQEYTIFLDMWSEADEGLPQLDDARQRLQALKAKM